MLNAVVDDDVCDVVIVLVVDMNAVRRGTVAADAVVRRVVVFVLGK